MTDYEFGQAVMKAARVEPNSIIETCPGGCGHARGSDRPNVKGADNWPTYCIHVLCMCDECLKPSMKTYPDPLTPEGFCILWDALFANGYSVRVWSDTVFKNLHFARVDVLPLPALNAPTKEGALLRSAAQALGVTR